MKRQQIVGLVRKTNIFFLDPSILAVVEMASDVDCCFLSIDCITEAQTKSSDYQECHTPLHFFSSFLSFI